MTTSTDPVAAGPRPVHPVGILAALLDDLVQRAGTVAGLDADFAAGLQRAARLAGGLDPYVEACTTPESAGLRALARRTAQADWTQRGDGVFLEQEMLSGHVEGQVLKTLVHATGARRVLEIGMFTGYSALAMAEALPAGGEVVACELDAGVAAFAQCSFDDTEAGARIRVRVGAALDTLRELDAAGEVFDFVFVDADKGGYLAYVELLLDSGLLAPDALICVDNTLLQGQPYGGSESSANGDAIAEFNRAVADDPRVEQVLLPVRDGLTLIRRTEEHR